MAMPEKRGSAFKHKWNVDYVHGVNKAGQKSKPYRTYKAGTKDVCCKHLEGTIQIIILRNQICHLMSYCHVSITTQDH